MKWVAVFDYLNYVFNNNNSDKIIINHSSNISWPCCDLHRENVIILTDKMFSSFINSLRDSL